MSHYSKENVGKLKALEQHIFAPEGLETPLAGKVFLKDLINLNSMEVSLNKDAPGTGVNFFHRHKNNEEVYIFIGGKGHMIIDDERFAVEEGDVIRVSPEARRSWWNTGSEDLYYIVIQAKENSLDHYGLTDAEFLEDKVPWN